MLSSPQMNVQLRNRQCINSGGKVGNNHFAPYHTMRGEVLAIPADLWLVSIGTPWASPDATGNAKLDNRHDYTDWAA